jgi:hypothetical protein
MACVNPCQAHVDEILNFQETSLENGLNSEEVAKRLQIYGANILQSLEKVITLDLYMFLSNFIFLFYTFSCSIYRIILLYVIWNSLRNR